MVFRATRTPETSARGWKSRELVRYDTSHPWPGIPAEHPRDWCQRCTRATLHGVRQVKYIDALCETHASWVRHG